MARPLVHWQKRPARLALVPRHCDGVLRPVMTYYEDGSVGPPPPQALDTRTVAEREWELYREAMAGG